jgi:hypothetical protein
VTAVDRAGIGAGASGIQPRDVPRQRGTRAACLMANDSYAFYRTVSERLPLTVERHESETARNEHELGTRVLA